MQAPQSQFKIINNQRVAEFSSSDGEEVIIQKKQRKMEKFKWTKQKQIKFQLVCLLIGYDQISPRKIIQWMNDPQISNQVAGSHIQKWKLALMKQEGVNKWNQIKNYQYLNDLENQKIKKIAKFWRNDKFQGFNDDQIKYYLLSE